MSEKMFEPKYDDSFNKVPEKQKDQFKPAENGDFVYKEVLSKEDAEIEAERMQDEIKSEEAGNYAESERLVETKKIEEDLSPEIIESIMKKVQYINQEGIAYNSISWNTKAENDKRIERSWINPESSEIADKMNGILRDGLLGLGRGGFMAPNYDHIQPDKGGPAIEEIEGLSRKEEWALNAKKYRKGLVFFNIVGADNLLPMNILESKKTQKTNEIAYSRYVQDKKKPVIVLFNLKEKDKELISKQLYPNINEVDDEFGFVLPYRIAPRRFTGLVINNSPEKVIDTYKGCEEEYKPLVGEYKEMYLFPVVREQMLKCYKEKKELLLPIYDLEGNLLWPKRMSYEEVKKFVAERDKNKKE